MATNSSCITAAKKQWDSINIPKAFSHLPIAVDSTAYPRVFEVWGSTLKSNYSVSKANCYFYEVLDSFIRSSSLSPISLIQVGDQQFAAEHTNSKGETTIISGTTKGLIKGCCVSGGSFRSIDTLPSDSVDLAPLYAVYFALLCNTTLLNDTAGDEKAALFKSAVEALKSSTNPYDETENLFLISETVLTGLKAGKFPCKITNGNVTMLQSQIISTAFDSALLLHGTPSYLKSGGLKASSKKVYTAKQVKEMPIFSDYTASLSWSEDEEKLIPSFPDDYPVVPETIKIARHIVLTKGKRRPMVNFLWRGCTAYGKSTGVEMLAYILHTPLLRITCYSGMEAQSFLAEYVPDNDIALSCAHLPSIDEIKYDPENAYYAMTGRQCPGISAQEALLTYGKVCAQKGRGSSARFKLVESNYVKALKSGYICEVQEMSRIKDSGTMVTLNEYNRSGAVIPLVDGSSAVRSPNAIVIYTDNVGYSSCHTVDPSVIRRMDAIYDSFELDEEHIINRIRYNTGFDDIEVLKKMMNVWENIRTYCKDQDITDGEISVNELERWVDVYLTEGIEQYLDGCLRCVVAKASPDRDIQQEIWTSVVKPLIEGAAEI